MLAPWLLGFLIFTAGPLVASLFLSFTDYDVSDPLHWLGLQNFRIALHDPLFWNSCKVNHGVWNGRHFLRVSRRPRRRPVALPGTSDVGILAHITVLPNASRRCRRRNDHEWSNGTPKPGW